MLAWGTVSKPTSPVLPVGKVGGDGDPPALPHARALKALVHPRDDVTLPHIGIVGVVAGVAAIQGRGGGAARESQGPHPAWQLRDAPAPTILLRTPCLPPTPSPGITESANH